jgi:hypothetical protein
MPPTLLSANGVTDELATPGDSPAQDFGYLRQIVAITASSMVGDRERCLKPE